MWDGWKKKIKLRIRKLLGMPLPPRPFELVWEKEAELFKLFKRETGEYYPDFRLTPADTVVDVGCGIGAACVFAANQGAETIGIDIDPGMIERTGARLREETSSQRWKAYVSDSNPLPLPSGIATKVICQEVLEHVDDPAVVMAELARIGRPGAQYLLSVPDPASESIFREIAPETYWRKPCHLRIFGREEFDHLVERAGLTIEQRSSYSFYWSMWWILFWADPRGNGPFGGPNTSLLRYWNKTWDALIAAPDGMRIKQALDNFMPKCRFVLARKAA